MNFFNSLLLKKDDDDVLDSNPILFVPPEYLTFSSHADGSTLVLNFSDPNNSKFYYKILSEKKYGNINDLSSLYIPIEENDYENDPTWIEGGAEEDFNSNYDSNPAIFKLDKNEHIAFIGTPNYVVGSNEHHRSLNSIQVDGNVDVAGKLASIYNLTTSYNFRDFFKGSRGLVNAQYLILPESASSLAIALGASDSFYQSMFEDCFNLLTAPLEIYATGEYACYSMFKYCTKLISGPLKITTFNDYSHAYMFDHCSNLTTAPKIMPDVNGRYNK